MRYPGRDRRVMLRVAVALACGLAASADAATPRETAQEILDAAGTRGGFVVHVGCGDGRLTAALARAAGCVVQGLDADAGNVAEARRHVRSEGLETRVLVDRLAGNRLPYINNLAALVVADDLAGVPIEEVMRVLAPGGTACVRENGKWTRHPKPRPKTIDEWTHYLYDATNNAVARDTSVGPPRHVQWLAGPLWTRNHHKLNSISSVVTAGGRLFYIADEATAANMSVPGKWRIVARDAFSGVTLWKKPMASWAWYRTRFRSGPPQVTRLLVTDGRRVYAPLGLDEPVSALDAATGETLATYEQTAGAEEIVLTGKTLLVLKGEPVAEHAKGHRAYKKRFTFPNRKTVVAIDADTGKTRWRWSPEEAEANLRPETLASDGERVYVQVDEAVACLDLASGKARWTFGRTGKMQRKKLTFGTFTLVVADGVVLCNLSGHLTALAAETGERLWQSKAGGGFHAPVDVFVIDGLVWPGDHPRDSVAPPPVTDFSHALDLHTGKVRRENRVLVDLQTSGHHHRCYREKATVRYIITGKRGIEMMDLADAAHSRNNWVRGTCQYGVLPANGLLYTPPHSCGCYMESKLWGFYALASAQPALARADGPDEQSGRLRKGPAYGQAGTRGSDAEAGGRGTDHREPEASDAAWPTYRHDALRSGVAGTDLPGDLARVWTADLGGRLTQPVIAGGLVVLAATDARRVVALDAATGKVRWSHTAGGRIDSAPTLDRGRVLFGSADGRVTCLRASDGKVRWRFLAAPADVRTVALDQVESLWPVHGSVLVVDGVAYCSAGRSTWLDGGIHLYGLDPATGKVLHRTRFDSEHPAFRAGKEKAKPDHRNRIDQNTTDYKTFLQSDRSDSFSMAGGAISDVLVSNGTDVFLHHVRFGPDLARQQTMGRHLFSTSSLLDDTENHRSHWVLGTGDFSRVPVAYSWIVNHPGRRGRTIAVPTGVVMVFSDTAIWGVQRKGDANGRYRLFRSPNRPFAEDAKGRPDFRERKKGQKGDIRPYDWKHDLPVRPRAMLKAGERLVLGVMPVKIPEDDPHAAYEGRLGGSIWLVSAEDGSKVADLRLPSPVVWDGMAAADGRLYLATASGKVVCFGE